MKFPLSLIISVTAFIAALAAFGYVFVGTQTAVASAIADRAAAAAAGQAESTQKNLAAFVAQTANERGALDAYVATDESIVSVISEIETAGTREKVSPTIGALSPISGDWRYHETLEITLSATGSFAGLEAFSNDLESLPYASHLAHVEFQPSSGGTWFASFTLDVLKEKSKAAASPS